jgi:heptose I phosphotransferase
VEANVLVGLAKQQAPHVMVEHDNVTLPTKLLKHLPQSGLFEYMMQLQGKAFRDVPGRKTMQISIAGKSYFIKQHFGVGWGEIFKNLLTFKKPVLGAITEVNAIQKLNSLGIATTPLVAYGQQGCSPATMGSFVLTEDLGDIINLEELSADWHEKSAEFKQKLMQALGALAAKLHGAGCCHRDFYLCHFVLKQVDLKQNHLNLYLIDLHRMLQGQPSNGSAVMKDIAGLYFSAKQCGFNAEDLATFRQNYIPQSDAFWAQVEARAETLLAKFNSEKFQAKLAVEREKLS